ncbi:MAG TPA: OmpA family protein [Polyangiaceae bacterium]|nr:OmpA family protein [Polyangiaceae bacterium]
MKKRLAKRLSYGGFGAALGSLWVGSAGAQVPVAAGTAAIGASAHAAGALSAGPAEPAPAEPMPGDALASDGFMQRFAPAANVVEAGLFVGPLFIADDNSFRGPVVVEAGRAPTLKPLSKFDAAPEIGVRGGYYPLTFLGGELEGVLAVAATDSNQGATVLAARAQVVAQIPYWSVVPFALAGAGYWAVLNEVSGNDSEPAFHFGGGAKLNVAHDLSLRVDVRDSITRRGIGSHPDNIEALAGANLVFGRAPAAPPDSDRDGVVDESDQCPLESGTSPSGCPIRDSDGDGIMDPDDRCVREAGVAPTGCPVRDADGDGVVDADDQCISEVGGAPTGCPDRDGDGFLDRADQCPDVAGVNPNGCPADADGDGIVGADDRCPDEAETLNGIDDADGCPDELPAAVQEFMGVIAGIEFERGQAAIRPSSELALDQALRVLTEYPALRIEIVGHTDDRGSREHNLELSQQRADAVKAHLVAKGIDPNRLQTMGAGPDAPLTSNETAAGRQKNRRIEFRVIR